MQAAVLEIAEGSCLEMFQVAGSRVQRKVVQSQYFWQVRQVVLVHVTVEIILHVVEGRGWPAMIEGARLVRKHQDNHTTIPENSQPFAKRRDRIRRVLQGMGGQEKIVGGRRNVRKVCRFADVLEAGRARPVKQKCLSFLYGAF